MKYLCYKIEIINITKSLNDDQIWQNVKWAPVKTYEQLESFVYNAGKWKVDIW